MLECIIPPFYVSIKHNHNSCPGGEIGRHTGLKILRLHGRAGSIPAPGTIFSKNPNQISEFDWGFLFVQLQNISYNPSMINSINQPL